MNIVIYTFNKITYENTFLGNFLVGIDVIICPHSKVAAPKKIHHIHNSSERGAVENAMPPNCTITTCNECNHIGPLINNKIILPCLRFEKVTPSEDI